ncbi:MAG: hypothetical protein A2905_02955 [Candidatus Levybacteria bacterium RIFCSPLOWO2_01_FULL_36_10]|nr:MAG: hypothetical protein A2905_02955 [Candidatus Levybacteria bacterium RIFCSPLOWO2_01_FULL_36_10]
MEILKQFGFIPQLFIAQVVNFLIIAYVFKRFLYKPILKMLKDREEKVKKSLEDAQKTTLILEKTEADRDKILKKTRIDAESILNDAKKIAEDEKTKILENSRYEADRIIKEAKVQASLEMAKMEKRISSMALDLSQKILNNVLSSIFSREEKETILKKASKELENNINYE